jgi:zinc D-Ala-D-Ala carboxypeptidase
MRLSPHFNSREFASHDGAATPHRQLHYLRLLCERYLEPLRAEFGPVRVVSGHRSLNHNRSVGGAGSSYHLRLRGRAGAAADVTCARGTPREWYDFLDALRPGGLGIYETHVHVDNRRGHARW